MTPSYHSQPPNHSLTPVLSSVELRCSDGATNWRDQGGSRRGDRAPAHGAAVPALAVRRRGAPEARAACFRRNPTESRRRRERRVQQESGSEMERDGRV